MEARDIVVPKKKNGDPNIQTSKSSFKQWLLEHDKETVEQDSGMGCISRSSPSFPSCGQPELMLVPPTPEKRLAMLNSMMILSK